MFDVTQRQQTEEELAQAREQICQLTIEIDTRRQAEQIKEITESEYFQHLQDSITRLRRRTIK